jgi:hypothetical protein
MQNNLLILEALAHSAFPSKNSKIINENRFLTNTVKNIFLSKNAERLKEILSAQKNFANESHVTQI